MKIAICNETYRDWSFVDAFQHASAQGYDGIEIAPFTLNPDAYAISDSQISEVVALAKQFHLQVVGLHWLLAFTSGYHLTSSDALVRQKTADYLARLAEVCRRLGGQVMVFGSPKQRNIPEGMSVETANQNALDCIRRVLPALQAHNVCLALEPLGPEEGNFLLTAQWGRQLVQQIDSPLVKLHLDVKAMSTEDTPIRDLIAASADELVHFHANDPNRRGPGMGDVDFTGIIEALQKIDYSGWLSVEVFDESVPAERTAVESIAYLRKIAKTLGIK